MFFFVNKFSKIYNLIYGWEPKRKYRSEKGFEQDLKKYLSSYASFNVSRGGRFGPDLLIDNSIAIEIEFNLRTKTQVQRLIRRAIRHTNKGYNVIIVLVGKTSEEKKKDIIKAIRRLYMEHVFRLGLPSDNIRIVTPPKAYSSI